MRQVPAVSAKSAEHIQQTLRILPDAEPYTHISLQIQLYISAPGQEYLVREDAPVEVCLVQRHELIVQVSSHHAFNPRSSILLVTNAETTSNRVQAIQKFIDNEIKLDMDEWNVGLYGGLRFRPDEDQSASSVLTAYYGKTILFLGNKFAFFGSNPRSVVELCDVRALADATLNGTTCVFLGSLGDNAYTALTNALVFPVPSETLNVDKQTTASTDFPTARDLITSIQQEKLVDSPKFALYTVPLKTRWYRLGKASPKSEARRLCNSMSRALPQERFLVTPIGVNSTLTSPQNRPLVPDETEREPPRSGKEKSSRGAGRLAVLHGNSHQLSVAATEEQQNINRTYINLPNPEDDVRQNEAAIPNIDSTRNHLSSIESYVIVASLPISRRADIAWKPTIYHDDNTKSVYSDFVLKAISFSLLLNINREIQTFLHRPAWPNQIPLPATDQDPDEILRLHFPILAAVLKCRHATAAGTERPPESIIELLQHAEASCLPQKKRHVGREIMHWGQRRPQLRKFLVRIIDQLLIRKGFAAPALTEFHSTARALHSIIHRHKRSVRKTLVLRASKFTQKSEHSFLASQKSATDLVPATTFGDQKQWNQRYAAIESSVALMNEDTRKAWLALGNMTLDS